MTARRFTGDRLVLATHNAGKLAELKGLMAPLGVAVLSSADLDLPEPVEDGSTFVVNARLKAEAAVAASGLVALADDSGLEVPGLDGEPGVHSARWAGPARDFSLAMARIRAALADRFGSFATADRRARFVTVLCLAWPDGHVEIAEGEISGHLVDPPRGENGFGYDPMFQPEGETRTFGEMPAGDKRALSHRARAMDRLLAAHFGIDAQRIDR